MPEDYAPQGKDHFQQQWEAAERKADDLEKRIDSLERENDRLLAAISGTPPMGQRPPTIPHAPRGDPSRAEPGSQRHSATRAERAEQEAQAQIQRQFQASPAALEIAKLRAQLTELNQWRSLLQGRGGIVVTDTIIEYRKNANGLNAGTGGTSGQLRLTLSDNGIPTDYYIDGVPA